MKREKENNCFFRLLNLLLHGPEKRTVGTLGGISMLALVALLIADSYWVHVAAIWYGLVAAPLVYPFYLIILGGVWGWLMDWKSVSRKSESNEQEE